MESRCGVHAGSGQALLVHVVVSYITSLNFYVITVLIYVPVCVVDVLHRLLLVSFVAIDDVLHIKHEFTSAVNHG